MKENNSIIVAVQVQFSWLRQPESQHNKIVLSRNNEIRYESVVLGSFLLSLKIYFTACEKVLG